MGSRVGSCLVGSDLDLVLIQSSRPRECARAPVRPAARGMTPAILSLLGQAVPVG